MSAASMLNAQAKAIIESAGGRKNAAVHLHFGVRTAQQWSAYVTDKRSPTERTIQSWLDYWAGFADEHGLNHLAYVMCAPADDEQVSAILAGSPAVKSSQEDAPRTS